MKFDLSPKGILMIRLKNHFMREDSDESIKYGTDHGNGTSP